MRSVGSLDEFVGDAPIMNASIGFDNPRVFVIKRIASLENIIGVGCQGPLEFLHRIIGTFPKHHIGVQQQGEIRLVFARFQGKRPVVGEIAEGFADDFTGDSLLLEKGFDDFHRVVRASRVANTIRINDAAYGLEQSANNATLVSDNHIETKSRYFGSIDYFDFHLRSLMEDFREGRLYRFVCEFSHCLFLHVL